MEVTTYASLLPSVLPYLPADLLRVEDHHRIQTLATHLPVVRLGCLEFRLEDEMQVDFMINISGKWNERKLIAGWEAQSELPFSADWLAGWRRAGSFFQQWADAGSWLDRAVSNQFLVFDLPDGAMPSAPLWYYFGLRPDFYGLPPVDFAETLKQIFSVAGEAFPDPVYERLMAVYADRPSDSIMPAFGALGGRDQKGIRAGIRPVSDAAVLTAFLNRVKWPGDVGAVAAVFRDFIACSQFCEVVLDFTVRNSSYLGLEFWLDGSDDGARTAAFFELLVKRGWCSPAKWEALKGFTGFERLVLPDGRKGRLKRAVNHVKLIWKPGEPIRAKVYLFVAFG